jgi:hypothetical protein
LASVVVGLALKISLGMHAPNPSIERTPKSLLRKLSVAAHVERYLPPSGAGRSDMTRRIVLLVLVLALATSCSKEPTGAEYFGSPSAERKTFDVKMLVPFTGEVKGVAIISNRGTETIGGKTYYKMVTTFEGIPGTQPETSYSRIAEDGVYSRKSTDTSAPETLEFPLPPTVGRTWSLTQDDLSLAMSIAAVEDFDTASKTYKRCLKVVGTGKKGGDSIEATSYYAPNVGMVLMSMKGPGFTMEMKIRE